MGDPRVSICIPTLNAEGDLAQLLPALARQRIEGGFELVVVDSDSSDCTRQLLRRAGARLTWIPRHEFRHGPTRNRLAASARGELLVFLTQDAVPEGDDFLQRLTAPLDDPAVAGATARVLPKQDDDPLTARTVLSRPEASERCSVLSPDDPEQPRFNDVASAVRSEALAELPFPDLVFGEDVAWAESALKRGWKLAFAADAVVRHAHRYGPAQAFERYRLDAAFHRRHHGRRLRPGPVGVLRGWAFELGQDWRYVARHGGWLHLLRAPFLRGAQVLGQLFGSRGWRGLPGAERTREFT